MSVYRNTPVKVCHKLARTRQRVIVTRRRRLSPVSTTRVDGPSWRVTGFHNPSTRAVLTGARFHYSHGPSTRLVETHARQHGPRWRVMETAVTRQLGPLTWAVNSGSGNQPLKRWSLTSFLLIMSTADGSWQHGNWGRIYINLAEKKTPSHCACFFSHFFLLSVWNSVIGL